MWPRPVPFASIRFLLWNRIFRSARRKKGQFSVQNDDARTGVGSQELGSAQDWAILCAAPTGLCILGWPDPGLTPWSKSCFALAGCQQPISKRSNSVILRECDSRPRGEHDRRTYVFSCELLSFISRGIAESVAAERLVSAKAGASPRSA